MKKILMAGASASLLALSSGAWSACVDSGIVTDIDNTDGCTSVIDLTIDNAVRVTGLEDIDLTANYTVGAGGTFTNSTTFCLASNAATSTNLTLESSRATATAGNGYNLGNAAGTETIVYDVNLTDAASNALTPAESVATTLLPAAVQSDLNCAAEAFTLEIEIATPAADAAPAGAYQAVLTLVVDPL